MNANGQYTPEEIDRELACYPATPGINKAGDIIRQLRAELTALRAAPVPAGGELATRWKDCAEYGWTIIANVSGGNWDKETKDWQEAAAKFRDLYHACLDASKFAPPDLSAARTEATLWQRKFEGAEAEVARLQKAKIDACIAWTEACAQLKDMTDQFLAVSQRLAQLEAALPGVVEALDNLLHGYRDHCKRYDLHPQKCAEDADNSLTQLRALLSGKEGG